MKKPRDLTFQRFGKVVAVHFAGNAKCGKIQWLCKCDCGRVKLILTNSLMNSTKSCGCYKPMSKKTIKALNEGRKICNTCGEDKQLEYYHRHNGSKDGHRGACKECTNKAQKGSYNDKLLQEKVVPEFKFCRGCGETKSKTKFRTRSDSLNGLTAHCRKCLINKSREYYQENSEEIIRKTSEHAKNNRERYNEYVKQYRIRHRERLLREGRKKYKEYYAKWKEKHLWRMEHDDAYAKAFKKSQLKSRKKWESNPDNIEKKKKLTKAWSKKNKDLVCYYSATRRAKIKRASPVWANQEKIKQIYKEASEMGMDVDHIIPLTSDLVCGLHCEFNMQLLSRSDNSSKHNKFDIQEHVLP